MSTAELTRIDHRPIADNRQEIRAFMMVWNESIRLQSTLKHYRELGVTASSSSISARPTEPWTCSDGARPPRVHDHRQRRIGLSERASRRLWRRPLVAHRRCRRAVHLPSLRRARAAAVLPVSQPCRLAGRRLPLARHVCNQPDRRCGPSSGHVAARHLSVFRCHALLDGADERLSRISKSMAASASGFSARRRAKAPPARRRC